MTEKNKKEFHITITNNLTGEIKCDFDTNCILASILLDKGCQTVALAHTSGMNVLKIVNKMLDVLDKLADHMPGDENDEGKQNEEN
ncbi:MAG: hypothetical protein IKT42_04565 [Clostridia bacterium]|nr:hypothetical protein [Clostridia bacterium]